MLEWQMGKIRDPIRFSDYFKVEEIALRRLGVLDPNLNVDTPLFIDPLLLSKSKHPEMRAAAKTYRSHFEKVITFLSKTKQLDDVAWRTAERLMTFPEVKFTCLGYGGSSVSGSGSGVETRAAVLATAKGVVDLGVEDPDLFAAMAVFEDKIGPDRIGDMTATVIMQELIAFNQRVLKNLKVPTRFTTIRLASGAVHSGRLTINPHPKVKVPIILVPTDVLRDLPVVESWSDVSDVAARNKELRDKINRHLGDIWRVKTRKDKAEMRRRVLASKAAFNTFLEALKSADAQAYNIATDPQGVLVWRRVAALIAQEQHAEFDIPKKLDAAGVAFVVEQIINQFRFLIEERGLAKELYAEGKRRPESSAQHLFYAVAHSYCMANNIDITPEAETGRGPVDFKASQGFEARALVEIKLSDNKKLEAGYRSQLEAYRTAERTMHAYYVVIDVDGELTNKSKKLFDQKNLAASQKRRASEIILINGAVKPSASKLK